MPLRGWIHPLRRTKVPFGYFDKDCTLHGRPAASPWMCRAAELQVESDVRHAGLDITATRMLGCPRQTYIEVMFDYWLDPKKLELRVRGTAGHAGAEAALNPDVWYTEVSEPVRLTIVGNVGGYGYSMKCDALRKDLSEIVDFKFPMDFSLSRRGKVAKGDHTAQLNLARIGLAQQQWALDAGYNPDKVLLTLWDHAIGKNEGAVGLPADHWDEEQLLAYRPGGAEYTVEQILAMHSWAQQEHANTPANETVEVRERIASQIPLVGLPMFGGQKCGQYCDVEPVCSGLRRKYGEPSVTFEEVDEGEVSDVSECGSND